MWSRQFLARAQVKGYRSILEGKEAVPAYNEKIDETTSQGKTKLLLRNLNESAYSDLILSMEDEVNFALVDEATTKELPDGDAALAWKNLCNKHEPKTSATKVELKLRFNQSKLEDARKDPEEWVTELEILRQKLKVMKSEITDEDMMIHILNNLPKEYENLVEVAEQKLDDKSDPLDLEGLKTLLRRKYQRIKRLDSENDKEEEALLTRGTYKGRCHKCGQWGHKRADCKSNGTSNHRNKSNNNRVQGNNNNNNQEAKKPKFNGNCNYCKKRGHKEVDCFKKKREEGNKNKETASNAQQSEDSKKDESEVVLMSTVVKDSKISELTWIADTGASSHMTNSLDGMFDLQDCNTEMKLGNGKSMKAIKQRKNRGIIKQDNVTSL